MKPSINQRQLTPNHFWKLSVTLFFVSLLSVSCGSGGSGNTSAGLDETGSPTARSKGAITRMDANSLSVNGVDFNTDNANFTINGQSGSQDDLEVGMIAEINGHIDDNGTTGEAQEIQFETEIQGPIDSIDAINNSIVVLGRAVIFDNDTKIVNENGIMLTFSDLMENDLLEVSGLTFTDGAIQATHIKKKLDLFVEDLSEVELKGTLKMLDSIAKTFFISDQAVDYNGAVRFEEMSEGDLRDGLFIKVEGTRDSGGTLNARKIEKDDDGIETHENEEVEFEALVTDFTSSTSFSVAGQAVITDANTRFEGGAADDIALNVRLEVEGRINASGVLVADKIKFKGNRIKMETDIEDIDALNNTVTLFGQVVLINASTELGDDSSHDRSNFSFSDLAPGDRLKVRAYLSDGQIIATRVEREDSESEVVLQGPVEMISNPDLSILSVTVVTSSSTTFENRSENPITASDFFTQINTNTSIKVKGTLSSGDLFAKKIEIKG